MLKMKKVFGSIVILTMLFGLIPQQTAYASEQSNKVNTIIKTGKRSEKKAKLTNTDGTEYEVSIYEKKHKVSSNEYVQEYAYKLDENNMRLSVSGSQSQQKWDSTGGTEGFITIYYKQDGNKYLITRITGTWLIHESGTAIRDRKVMAVCNEGFFTDQYLEKNISSGSFDITTGWTRYADSTQGIVGIGAKSICTLYRIYAGTSWEFVVDNLIAGSVPGGI